MDGLVGDIGGTHARFALAASDESGIRDPLTLNNADHPSAEAAIEAYLGKVGSPRPDAVVLAVAGPVTHGALRLTNLDWELSEERLRREAGFREARLINDFAAQALGAPRVGPGGLRHVGPVGRPEGGTLAVMGPGTGFGLAGAVREEGRELVLATEGGHADFAPCDEIEVEVWRWFRRRHGRVSIERVLSGPGLYELYLALAEIEGEPATLDDQRQVQSAIKHDRMAAAAVERFCLILGGTAGDIALTLGARAGVYVTGGVAVGLADQIAHGGFRGRFEAKGRFESYMKAIPTWLILEPYTALLGSASVLKSLEPA